MSWRLTELNKFSKMEEVVITMEPINPLMITFNLMIYRRIFFNLLKVQSL